MIERNPTFLRAHYVERIEPGAGLLAVVAVTCGGTASGLSSVNQRARGWRAKVLPGKAVKRERRNPAEMTDRLKRVPPGDWVSRMKRRGGVPGGGGWL